MDRLRLLACRTDCTKSMLLSREQYQDLLEKVNGCIWLDPSLHPKQKRILLEDKYHAAVLAYYVAMDRDAELYSAIERARERHEQHRKNIERASIAMFRAGNELVEHCPDVDTTEIAKQARLDADFLAKARAYSAQGTE